MSPLNHGFALHSIRARVTTSLPQEPAHGVVVLTQVAEGDMLHNGERAKSEMRVAVIYHGYTDA